MTAAVFVDRDGVINEPVWDTRTQSFESPYRPEDVALVPGAAEGLARLAGFKLVLVSNQPSAAKGQTTLEALAAVHERVAELLRTAGVELDGVLLLPPPSRLHRPVRRAASRRPGCCATPPPSWTWTSPRSWMVGDADTDVTAAHAAGARAVLVEHPQTAHRRRGAVAPEHTAPDLRAGRRMDKVPRLTTKLFADGADLEHILRLAADERIRGFTTNPTLMWKAGLTDYTVFCRRLLAEITDRPISFEVFADDAEEIRRQARIIAGWGENVYVKVPVTTTRGESLADVVRDLSADGVQVNVTALFTPAQVREITAAVADGAPSYLSVFAGRIADTGRDPVPIMREALEIMREAPQAELIWASPRELLNVVQADSIGCHIITCTSDVLAKLGTLGKDLEQFSLETVQMFHRDAVTAGFEL